VAMTWRIEAS